MLRRKDLACGRILIVYLAAVAGFLSELEANEKSRNKAVSKDKLTSVLSALAPDKNIPAVLNRTRPSELAKTKKKDVLANVMNQLGTGHVRGFRDQASSNGQITEVSEPPREYDLNPQRRMEDSGSPRVINLPGMINVFGPPPKSRFARPRQDPLHILELPGLRGRSPHENYEVVPPHFNSENIPVHFFPNVQPPEVTGGKPRHIFLPFPKRFDSSLRARGLHGGFHGGVHGGLHGRLHGGFHGRFRSAFHEGAGNDVNDDDHDLDDGYRVSGLTPFHRQDISEFTRLPPESGVPLAAADQLDDTTGHVNVDGHEMGRFVAMPAPSIVEHPPKHIFEPGKEVTLDNGREIDMNNEMHVVEHGHHRQHHHFHDQVEGDDQYGQYDDHYSHEDDDQVVGGEHPDDVESYEPHGAPVSVADPEHVVHEHHNVEYHHHFGKARLSQSMLYSS